MTDTPPPAASNEPTAADQAAVGQAAGQAAGAALQRGATREEVREEIRAAIAELETQRKMEVGDDVIERIAAGTITALESAGAFEAHEPPPPPPAGQATGAEAAAAALAGNAPAPDAQPKRRSFADTFLGGGINKK